MRVSLTFLKIHPGEGSKVLRFALLAALLQAGLSVGISCADSLFLNIVGADKLPLIYLITPAMMLLYVPLFAYLQGRFGIDRLFDITLGILVAGGILLYIALTSGFGLYGASGPPVPIFYIAKLYTALWYISLYTLFWNFVDCYFHILDAKRLFSFFSGGMAFGAMIGGGFVTVFVQFIGARELFLVWSVLALAVFPVLIQVRKKCRKIAEEESQTEKKLTFKEQTGRVLYVLRTSRYANYMILTFLCTLVITTICEFQYMHIFEDNRTATEIAILFGKLYFATNAFNLLVNIFFFNRLTALIGVRNTALIQPVVYAVAYSYMLLQNGFGAAVAAFFAYQGVLTSIEYNNQNFLFNALPSREKTQVRTFLEGLCEPLATAAAGFFLLIYSSKFSPQFISLIGLAGAALAFCAVLGLRAYYLTAIVDNLKQAWLSFSNSPPRSLTTLDENNINTLIDIAKSENRELSLAAISVIWLNDRYAAVELLLRYLKETDGADHRAAKKLFSSMLELQDSTIFRKVLEWLEKEKENLDASLLAICGRYNFLSSEDIQKLYEHGEFDKRTAAAVARWQSWNFKDALDILKEAHQFSTGSEEERVAALNIIAATGQSRYTNFIAEHLQDSSPVVRKEALNAIARLAEYSSSSLAQGVLKAISGTYDRETRLAGFEAIRAIGDPSCVQSLINMSSEYPPCDRRHVEDIILDIGLPSVPILAAILRDDLCPHISKAVAARTLGMLSFPQFEALAPDLINSGIISAYRYLVSYRILATQQPLSKSTAFLAELNRDISISVVDYVLELLTIAGHLPDFEMLSSSLRSTNAKERADAIETIEQGSSRDIFRFLLPLVDSSPLDDKISFYRKFSRAMLPTFRDTLLSNAQSPIPLESAAAIHTAWQISRDNDNVFNRAEILTIMKSQLFLNPGTIVEDVVFALLSEQQNTGATNDDISMNSIEIASFLSSADFFSAINILEMEHIIKGTTIEEVAGTIYRRGTPCDSVYIVLKGLAVITGESETVVEKNCLLGAEALRGQGVYETDSHSQYAALLKVPLVKITRTAEIYPQVAISLLAKKIGINRYNCNKS